MRELEDATRAYRKAADALERARPRLADAIVTAAQSGMKQADIARVTGYGREQVRRICRRAGIEG